MISSRIYSFPMYFLCAFIFATVSTCILPINYSDFPFCTFVWCYIVVFSFTHDFCATSSPSPPPLSLLHVSLSFCFSFLKSYFFHFLWPCASDIFNFPSFCFIFRLRIKDDVKEWKFNWKVKEVLNPFAESHVVYSISNEMNIWMNHASQLDAQH